MKRDKQQSTFVNIGSSSLLIIFLVLSLTTFAILSLSSAQSDYSFSKRLAEHKTGYYEASSRAELILGEIDRILAETAEDTDLTAQLDGKELDGVFVSCVNSDGKTLISYEVPSDEKQALRVTLLVTNPHEQEHYYKIQSWQLISTSDWNADDTLHLMPMH